MISSEYRQKLLDECQKLDLQLQKDKAFEKIALDIVDNKNDAAVLALINQLGHLKQNKSLQKINPRNLNISCVNKVVETTA